MNLMERYKIDVPVALVFFIRPCLLKKVFAAIRQARPRQLFLIQDGPRSGRADDEENIRACRAIVEDIDWECEVSRNYAEHNLGCGMRPYTGISWVFEHVDWAIILEDDCVPSQSFFTFCCELLDYYENDGRIGMISGLNHFGKCVCEGSYFFAKSGANTGWATWKRVWEQYDYGFSYADGLDKRAIEQQFPSRRAARDRMSAWQKGRDRIHNGDNVSFWDLQLEACKFAYNYTTIIPTKNLVTNIGTGKSSTHNTLKSPFNNLPAYEMQELIHPAGFAQNYAYDRRYYRIVSPPLYKKAVNKMKIIAGRLFAPT